MSDTLTKEQRDALSAIGIETNEDDVFSLEILEKIALKWDELSDKNENASN